MCEGAREAARDMGGAGAGGWTLLLCLVLWMVREESEDAEDDEDGEYPDLVWEARVARADGSHEGESEVVAGDCRARTEGGDANSRSLTGSINSASDVDKVW